MTRILLAGAAALSMMTGAAITGVATAQTASSSTVTTSTMAPAAPVVTSTSQTVGSAVTADDVKSKTAGMTAVDSSGAKTEVTVTNTTYPLADMMLSTKKTTNVVNGVATETVETTKTIPATMGHPEIVTTETHTNPVVPK